jgi:hypothetical protein
VTRGVASSRAVCAFPRENKQAKMKMSGCADLLAPKAAS